MGRVEGRREALGLTARPGRSGPDRSDRGMDRLKRRPGPRLVAGSPDNRWPFSITDIRTLLDLAEPGDASCAEVEKVARTHLESVRAKLADLMKLERVLGETVDQCAVSDNPSCPVLDILTAPS